MRRHLDAMLPSHLHDITFHNNRYEPEVRGYGVMYGDKHKESRHKRVVRNQGIPFHRGFRTSWKIHHRGSTVVHRPKCM